MLITENGKNQKRNKMIEPENSLFLIIDVQEKFRPVLFKVEETISNIVKLVKVFQLLNIPIILSEQYPKGLGQSVKEVKEVLKEHSYIEKTSFDCFGDGNFLDLLKNNFSNKKHFIVCGIESHICVTQTVLSALSRGYDVNLILDSITSRKKTDYEIAIRRMEQEGAKVSSTEMIIFQMIKGSKHKHFKEISGIVK